MIRVNITLLGYMITSTWFCTVVSCDFTTLSLISSCTGVCTGTGRGGEGIGEVAFLRIWGLLQDFVNVKPPPLLFIAPICSIWIIFPALLTFFGLLSLISVAPSTVLFPLLLVPAFPLS